MNGSSDSALAGNGLPGTPGGITTPTSAAYGQLPMSFEPNRGQTDARVDFLARGPGYTAFLAPTQAVMSLKDGASSDVLRMRLHGSNVRAKATGSGLQAGVSNYLIGSDPAAWKTGIPNFGRVRYSGVYRGIDLVYHGDRRQLEYDFVVHPGARPDTIKMSFGGAQKMRLDQAGNLVLHTAGGDLVQHAPVAYQVIDGVRQAVSSRFVVGPKGGVGFRVGRHDQSRPLIIDPSLSYSTYLGGSNPQDHYEDLGTGIAVDSSGNTYVVGQTVSKNFPTMSPLQRRLSGGVDAFVTKFNAAGQLVYSTFLGGKDGDGGFAIAVDTSGNAFLTGFTYSPDFPTTSGALQRSLRGSSDAFVTKLNSSGSGLLYSTFLGGSGSEDSHAIFSRLGGIAVDPSGNAYVTGTTDSTDFPTVNAYQSTYGPDVGDVTFVAKLNTSGSALLYSTYLGGTSGATSYGIAVDSSGKVYVAGYAGSGFPTRNAYQSNLIGGGDAFLTKLDPALSGDSSLLYSTFLGGSPGDGAAEKAYGVAADNSGNAYLTGYTRSSDFPIKGAYQATYGGGPGDAFVTKLNTAASGADSLVYSTYLGGSGSDNHYGGEPSAAIAVDTSGNAYVTGTTDSAADFPISNAFQKTHGGGSFDVFITVLNASGSGLVFSSYLGGSDWEYALAIAVDGSGNAYLTGRTNSTNFPTASPYQGTKQGGTDVFVTKIAP
jgi:hypothetical protein